MEKEYFTQEEAAEYLHTNSRKIGLYRRNKLIKYGKLGKKYIYRKEWLDDFMTEWSGYDLSNREAMFNSMALKAWKEQQA